MSVRVLEGDWVERLRELPSESAHCCVTSPPYFGLRDYGEPGQVGLEKTPEEFIEKMVLGFREVRRVLRKDSTLWVVIGDSYAGSGKGPSNSLQPEASQMSKQTTNVGALSGMRTNGQFLPAGYKPKDLIGIPWLLAFALRADGWYLRSEITWAKKACMPESVTDRPTSATEKIFLFSRSPRYFYDADTVREELKPETITHSERYDLALVKGLDASHGNRASRLTYSAPEGGRNMRNFWLLGPEPFPEAHFAVFPTEIPRRAILAGTSEKGVCPACRAPWTRIVERTGTGRTYERGALPSDHRSIGQPQHGGSGSGALSVLSTTTGWQPSCRCDAGEPIPATVLDCFGGSGTTGLVADRLGRDAVLIELSPVYAAMARARISGDNPLFTEVA